MKQPHHVRFELPNGQGVVLAASCALCEAPVDGGIVCPVCDRVLCAEPCYGVHLIARDAADADADEVLAKIAARTTIEMPTPARQRWRRRQREDRK
jgi:uncharacterized Zn finger protein (UPF0148 family)